MLWALRKVEKLSLPTSECNVEMLRSVLPKLGQSTHAFISSASLRSLSEILDATDLIYRIHWAVRDSQLNRQSIPAQLNPDVVIERHYALNWLTFYAEDWDDVTTDT
jgi:hypothetical protein